MEKAFLLGAGLGTRLRPLTNSVPKPLVPYQHQSLACHTLDACIAAGIQNIAINTHHLPDEWDAHFPERTWRDATLQFFHEPTLLETGGGLKNIASFIGDDPLLVCNGDIVTDLDLGALIAAHKASGDVATLALRSHGDKCNVGISGDRITDMRHACGIDPGTHQFTGIYCVQPEILDLISPGEVISIVPAFLELIAQGKLGAHIVPDSTAWLDLGDRASYLAAHCAGGKCDIHPEATIDPTATIEASTIGAGCEVGAGVRISHSVLWPGTRVQAETQLDHCIVYSHTPASGVHSHADL